VSQELVCITCPMGCRLAVDRKDEDGLVVVGNRCPRGAVYAREELLAPKRTVTATCGIAEPPESRSPAVSRVEPSVRRVPCRSADAFPRERVGELLVLIHAQRVRLPVERGQVLIQDALGSGIDIVATRTIR
jgi:CxxC motif-containing protein